jgi:DNA-binding response OmpR family regulator
MRVLVVESAPDRAGLLHERLRRVGHAVDVTADAALGLEALVDAPGYDVAVIDVARPRPTAWPR